MILSGKLEKDIYGTWDDVVKGLFIDDNSLESLLIDLTGKNVRIVIEEIPEESEDEPTINVNLRIVVQNDYLSDKLGINRYCIAEGADPYAQYKISLSDAKKAGLI